MRVILLAMVIAAAPAGAYAGAAAEVDTVMNRWHRAAATADEEVFFGSMIDGGIYLGTDPGERWTKRQLEEWSREYFDRETAWAFRPYNRFVYFSPDNNTAWFDELLETWMGTCRGSGVLLRRDGEWKIAQYNLSVTVPNELIDDYIGLLKHKPEGAEKSGDN